MGTEKRERQKAGRIARMEAEMAAEAAERRKRTIVRGVIIAALVIGVIVLYSVFAGGDDDGDGTTTAASTTVATTAAPTTAAPESDSELAVAPADIGCPAEDGSSETFRQFAEAPPMCIDEDADYVASFQTSVGDFDVFIDPTLDPISANNFVFLARYGAYDGTIFHRTIEDFVLQGGDVQLADDIGNPGYPFTGGVPVFVSRHQQQEAGAAHHRRYRHDQAQ